MYSPCMCSADMFVKSGTLDLVKECVGCKSILQNPKKLAP